jgi:hypothetical protein
MSPSREKTLTDNCCWLESVVDCKGLFGYLQLVVNLDFAKTNGF